MLLKSKARIFLFIKNFKNQKKLQNFSKISFANITAGNHTQTAFDEATEANIRSILSKAKEKSKAMRNSYKDIQNQETAVAFFETLFETLEMLTTSQEQLLDALKSKKATTNQTHLQAQPQTYSG